jgi:predicted TIM-barrel fold metal-dependent hydrolase
MRPSPLSCDCHIHVFGPFARELVKRNPQRMVWGTDWPHPDVAVVPEDAGLLATLLDWVPDEAARHRILVDNPAKLYRF